LHETDDPNSHTLTHLLDGMDHAAQADVVTLRDVIAEFGDRSITPFILLISLLLVSPLSGIPGAPTLGAIAILLLSVQALTGRRRLWLPQFLLNRQVAASRLRAMVRWLRKPCALIDRIARRRLVALTRGTMRFFTLLACTLIPLGWPPLEVLPFVSSIGAGTVALMAFGLFTRDGLFVLLGYMMIALTVAVGYSLLSQV
jgi:hypothetical protein